ncbi:MAG TPA: bifunctional serine/threonine-protein kinase/formylglycine-generating enzyme family protein, partial [Pirellulaceae bacterium]|nr:bifunctional serine/threonine-protein kinase/formylglycine-generating enzyme family protein [Pirellulaceae bacterium]
MNEPTLPEESLFLQALELDSAADQAAFLDRQCGSNAELRSSVEGLLRHHREGSRFLESPPTEVIVAGEQLTAGQAETPALDFLTPSAEPASIGRLGHYEILELLGSGGFGVVLKARDAKLDRIVAVKTLAQSLASSATARRRFVREAKAAAAVRHENVVGIYHVSDEGPVPYLVMECVSGLSLEQKLQQAGMLDVAAILRIGMQVASGLAAAHKQGLVHRDVKPGNILLENGVERVKITDFGLARAANDAAITRTGEVAGTPQYMSPEQALGQPVDARSDLFSLGSVLYAMCTGRSPFRAETTIAALRRVCDDAPRPIREVNSDIPAWLVAIIDRLLAKKPDDRFQTAAEVADVLGQHLAHLQHPSAVGQASRLPVVTTAGQRPAPRARPWAIAAAALVLLLLGISLTEATGVTNVVPTVIRIVTGEGTLIVETDPDVQVTLESNGVLNFRVAGGQSIRVPTGEYRVKATKDGQQVPLEKDLVTISRGGEQIVRVRLERGPGTIAGKEPPPSAIVPFDAATAKEHQEAWAKYVGLPVEFANSIGMKFRLIPPGEFEMGSTPQDIEAARAAEKYSDDQAVSDALTSEGPIHRVVLSEPFYLSVTEVTQQDFETVTGENPSTFRLGGENAEKVKDADAGQLPAQGTSWNDAANFCSRLSVREGLISNYRPVGTAVEMLPGNGYRLPREAQWEFACRAGTTTRFWFGNDPADHANREWLQANSAGRPQRVGSLAKNPFGLFDMHGNVSEWV